MTVSWPALQLAGAIDRFLALPGARYVKLEGRAFHVLHIGDDGYVWLVVSGWLLGMRGNAEGRLKGTGLFGPGDLLGMSSLGGNVREVPFYSIGETEVIQVSRLALDRAVERDDTLCRWLLKYMCMRYSELLDELEVSTLLPLRQRIEAFERKLTQKMPVSVERPVPQTVLAWAVGGHPVSVCRALKGA
ncbi:Crp/Fnr family transcriptional regulator [Carboxydochorda subterranea]|uniref:Crp/Fnr family transcriptional regulator n=1 Tax=Carboxydichorda subterranea TaxID=3109565 RepID=A0ABZ1BXG3_9FIRM|nr:Crp/Fnr family transcriptional regulator [Limnochorda sp. L945t]WRP17486.1 Crp/Fnr family transcriptional regulator [Limnochorda sp. L945t]